MLNRLSSIKLKLLLILIPGVVIALVMTFSVMFYNAEQQFNHKLEQKQQSLSSYAELLGDPLWNFNNKRIDNILHSMMLDPDVIQISIVDEGGNSIFEKASQEQSQKQLVSGNYAYPINYSNAHIQQKVGELRVALGFQSLEKEKAEFILSGVLSILLVVSVLAASTWLMFSKVMDTPIKALINAIQRTKQENKFIRVTPSTNDELGVISAAFNEMQENLENNHKNIVAANEKLQLLYHSTPALLFSFDQEGVIQDASDYFLDQLAFSKDDIIGIKLSELLEKSQKDEGIDKALSSLWQQQTLNELPLNLLNGRGETVEILMDATLSAQDLYPSALAVITDVTSLNQARRKLEHQANTDHLSGIANRYHFQTTLEQLTSDRRRSEQPFALLFIDLDHFKAINDTYGHQSGDKLLCQVTERIQATLRPSDLIARLGGDEFAVILKHLDSANSASMIAERIIQRLETAFLLDTASVFISASIGIAIYPQDCSSPSELIQNADLAMYRAKDEGRSRLATYSSEHSRIVQQRLKIENLLRHAISENRLEIHYQPIISLAQNKVVGVEALLRLRDDDDAYISPENFIPIAEETGLIVEIGEWCVQHSCLQLAEWHKHVDEQLYLSVNVSTRQFHAQSFYVSLEDSITHAKIEPSDLIIEITESLLLHDNQNNLDLFESIESLGCQIAIDDFGTGYSALSYLMKFPLSVLKIDRSFISSDEDAQFKHSIVEAIIQMSQSMNLKVIAEGVESQEQLKLLRTLSDDEIAVQGYFFSKPLPPKELSLKFEAINKQLASLPPTNKNAKPSSSVVNLRS